MRHIMLWICLSFILLIQQTSCLQYQLVFNDEFDRNYFIDQSKWNVVDRPSNVNNELQWYSRDDAWTEHGFLFLRGQKRLVAGSGTSRQYSAARVDTKGKFELFYGEVEWRVQLPKGRGLWPALWLLQFQCPAATPCVTWPPEIDVLEARGDRPNRVTQALHYGRYPHKGSSGNEFDGPDFTAGFHTYKVVWDPTQVVWFVDGRQIYRITDPNQIPKEKMYLIMNLAVGGDYAGAPDGSTPFPAHMIIDYVRVWRWQ